MAKITLSYPGWKQGKVTPATIEVPIEPMSWRCLFWDYLIWPLGVAVVAAVGWIVWRAWRTGRLGKIFCYFRRPQA
jgi:nitrate reductase NapE component